MQTDIATYDDLDRFARDLERSGAAYHAGYSVKLIHYGSTDQPAYDRVIHGHRETITGFGGQAFESLESARLVAICGFRQHFALA